LNGVLDDQQRICNRRRVSHPPPSLPAAGCPGHACPARARPLPHQRRGMPGWPRRPRRPGPGRREQNAAQAPGFTDRRIVLMAFWAQHARPQKLRPAQSAPGFKPNQAGASDITEIICLVTVTCGGNGAAAARPALIPAGACDSGSDRARPARAQAGTRHRRAPSHRVNFRPLIVQPARFPARVGWRPGEGCGARGFAPRRRGGSRLALLKGRVGDWSARAPDWPARPRGRPADRDRHRRGPGGMQRRPRAGPGAVGRLPGTAGRLSGTGHHRGRSPARQPAG